MLPIEFRDFINIFSLVVFGAVVVSTLVALVAYLFSIDRKKAAKKIEDPTAAEAPDREEDANVEIPIMTGDLTGHGSRDSF